MLEFDLSWDDFDAAIDKLEREEITPMIRGLVAFTWNSILVKTPQYHGRLVASWNFSLNEPQFLDRSDAVRPRDFNFGGFTGPLQPRYRGHKEAIEVANSANRGKDAAFRLGDTVWFANGANHGEGSYAALVEDSNASSWLRAYNRPGQPVSRTLDMINAKFSVDVPGSVADRFKTMTLGSSNDV